MSLPLISIHTLCFQFLIFPSLAFFYHKTHTHTHTKICISVMNISLYIYHNSHKICLNQILGVEPENGTQYFVSVRVFSVEWTVILLWHVCENLKTIFVCAWTRMTNKYLIKCRVVHPFLYNFYADARYFISQIMKLFQLS